VDVHKGREGGLAHVDRRRRVKNLIFCGRHKWMAPIVEGTGSSERELVLFDHY